MSTTMPTTSAPQLPSTRLTASALQELASRVRTEAPRETLEVEQPFTGGPLGGVPRCAPEDVAAALRRARAAQAEWAKTSFADRRQILLRFHDLVLARQDEILDLVQMEAGKARRHALEEVLDAAIVARYYANTAETHLTTHRRRGALPFLTKAHELRHPVGVVSIIAPWNYPLALTSSDAVPALMAGKALRPKPPLPTP